MSFGPFGAVTCRELKERSPRFTERLSGFKRQVRAALCAPGELGSPREQLGFLLAATQVISTGISFAGAVERG